MEGPVDVDKAITEVNDKAKGLEKELDQAGKVVGESKLPWMRKKDSKAKEAAKPPAPTPREKIAAKEHKNEDFDNVLGVKEEHKPVWSQGEGKGNFLQFKAEADSEQCTTVMAVLKNAITTTILEIIHNLDNHVMMILNVPAPAPMPIS